MFGVLRSYRNIRRCFTALQKRRCRIAANASIAIRCGKENEDCGELADIIKLFVRIRIPADGIYQDAMPQFRRSGVQSDRKRIGGSRSVYKCLYTNPETHGYLTEAKSAIQTQIVKRERQPEWIRSIPAVVMLLCYYAILLCTPCLPIIEL